MAGKSRAAVGKSVAAVGDPGGVGAVGRDTVVANEGVATVGKSGGAAGKSCAAVWDLGGGAAAGETNAMGAVVGHTT